jgi:hypothetical protein
MNIVFGWLSYLVGNLCGCYGRKTRVGTVENMVLWYYCGEPSIFCRALHQSVPAVQARYSAIAETRRP